MMLGDLAYLTDPRDRAVCGLTPTLMAPRFGELAPVPVGQYRFVAAANGLFLQARSKAMAVTLRVGDTVRLPYGEMQESVELYGGPVPGELAREMMGRAVSSCPNEWAGVVVYEPGSGKYRLIEPEVESVSGAHVRYRTDAIDPECVVLDVHSHGDGRAFFSSVDDKSDQYGLYIASVLGHCERTDTITVCTRIVVNGIFYEVPWVPWHQ